MAKFKVGDKVEVISTKYYTAASIGDKGTVVKVDFHNGDDSNYAVRMDRKIYVTILATDLSLGGTDKICGASA